jgi:hypothetical protein
MTKTGRRGLHREAKNDVQPKGVFSLNTRTVRRRKFLRASAIAIGLRCVMAADKRRAGIPRLPQTPINAGDGT